MWRTKLCVFGGTLVHVSCGEVCVPACVYFGGICEPSGNDVDVSRMTPKQIAKAFVRYGTRRPDTGLSAYLIPQIPGSRRNSSRAHGVIESLLRTKKYVIPLAVVQPWVPAGLATSYVATGRFNPYRYATRALEPVEVERRAMGRSCLFRSVFCRGCIF